MASEAMKVLIADDEAPARLRLRQMLDELDDYEVIGEASHGLEVLEFCAGNPPDIVLLDIRMPEIDGIETARHLMSLETTPAVIFTTAYDNYAIEAFDTQAIGYLLKPVRRERLTRALNHAAKIGKRQLDRLGPDKEEPPARSNICVRKSSGLKLIPVDEVMYFQADQKYITVHHINGDDLIDEPLKDLADEFSGSFIRIHRSVLIAAAYLDRMDKNTDGQYQVWLKQFDSPLPVSRRHATEVKARLKRGS